jgi:hypothetical protein
VITLAKSKIIIQISQTLGKIEEATGVFSNSASSGLNAIFDWAKIKTESSSIEDDITNSKSIEEDMYTISRLESPEVIKMINEINDPKAKRKSLFIRQSTIDSRNDLIELVLNKYNSGVYTVLKYVEWKVKKIIDDNKDVIPVMINQLNDKLTIINKQVKPKPIPIPSSTTKKHTGGLIHANEGLVVDDLQPNERIIKALVGERVLSIEQNKAFEKMILEGGGGGGGQDTYITNNYTFPIDMESFREALARPENREIIKGFNALNIKLTGRSF